jgi:glutamate synthase (NADPH/NADH) small chain
MSLGCSVNPIVQSSDEEVRTNKWGVILVDPQTCETNKKGVYAAGDAITGGSTVILAMGQAKKAAAAMHDYVMGGHLAVISPPDSQVAGAEARRQVG